MSMEVFPLVLKYGSWSTNKLPYDKKTDEKKESWWKNWWINFWDRLYENI